MNDRDRLYGQAAALTGLAHLRAARILQDSGHHGPAASLAIIATEEFGKAIALWACALTDHKRPYWLTVSHQLKSTMCDFAWQVVTFPIDDTKTDPRTLQGAAGFFEVLLNDHGIAPLLAVQKRNEQWASSISVGVKQVFEGSGVNPYPSDPERRHKVWRSLVDGDLPELPDEGAIVRELGLYADELSDGTVTSPNDVLPAAAGVILEEADKVKVLVTALLGYLESDESASRLAELLSQRERGAD